MSDLLDHAAAIRQGEELDLATLEPYLRRHFPNEAAALRKQGQVRPRYGPRISRALKAPLRLRPSSRSASILRRRFNPRRTVLRDGTDPRHHPSQKPAARVGFSS